MVQVKPTCDPDRRYSQREAAELLGQGGVAVRAGLHCAPLAHESAGTLRSGTVRFSFSPRLRRDDVLLGAKYTKEILGK